MRRRLETLGATELGANILEAELANHLALEVVASLAGFHQGDPTGGSQDGHWKARKARAGADIGQGIDFGQPGGQCGGVQNQPADDLGGRAVAGQIVSLRPLREQGGQLEQRRELVFGDSEFQLGESLGQQAASGGISCGHRQIG